MRAGSALLDPTDVQGSRSELDLLPAKVHQFGRPQAVPVGHKDHRGIPVAIAVSLGDRHEPVDLGFGQVLRGLQLAVGEPLRRNCSIYGGWRDQLQVCFGQGFRPLPALDCS